MCPDNSITFDAAWDCWTHLQKARKQISNQLSEFNIIQTRDIFIEI